MDKEVNYEILEYNVSLLEIWDNFIENSLNGNIFHTQKFLDYHSSDNFTFRHLLIYQNGKKLVGVVPAGIMDNKFVSPVGSSFGGIIVSKKNNLLESINILDALVSFCVKENYDSIKLTLSPQIYNDVYSKNIEFALMCKGFDNSFSLYHSVIDLSKKYSLIN